MLVISGVFIIELGIMAVLKLCGAQYDIEAITLLIIAINSVIFCFSSQKYFKLKGLHAILIMSLILRILLLFVDFYFMKILHSGADSEGFHLFAQEIGSNIDLLSQTNSYYAWLGVFYWLVGPARLLAQYINLICGLVSCLFVYLTMEKLELSKRSCAIAFANACFLPNWMDMSVILLRESIIILFMSISFYQFIKWVKKGNKWSLISSLLLMVPAIHLHSGMVAISIAYILCAAMYSIKRHKTKFNLASISLISMITAFFLFIVNRYGGTLLPYIGSLDLNSLFRIQDYGNTNADIIGSAYLTNLQLHTWSDLIFATPIKVLYFLFSPMPWDWRGASDAVAFLLSALPIVIFITYSIYSIFKSRKNRYILVFIACTVLIFSITYAWGTVAAGTAMRHRDKIVPLYLIMFGLALDAMRQKNLYNVFPKWIHGLRLRIIDKDIMEKGEV